MQSSVQRFSLYRVVALVLLMVLVVFFAFPLYWIITGSFKSAQVINAATPQWFPVNLFSTTDPGWTAFLETVGLATVGGVALIALAAWLHKRDRIAVVGVYAAVAVVLLMLHYVLAGYDKGIGLLWPEAPQLDNYTRLFSRPALSWMGNTLFICGMAMLLTCITATMAGYALAKKRFAGRALIFSIFISAMALPKQVILIPLLKEMSFLNLHNTLWAVILPTVGWPFGVFLMKQFSENIPGSILEATRIDGAGEVQAFVQIVLPMVAPGIGALAIFTFISAWNDYFLQLLMLNTRQTYTISVGIAKLQDEMSNDFGLIMAGAALAAIPIVLIFLVFQRFFTRGITMGAVKG